MKQKCKTPLNTFTVQVISVDAEATLYVQKRFAYVKL
jgi:hypothetical protein